MLVSARREKLHVPFLPSKQLKNRGSNMARAFEGIKVLDFTQVVSGPVSTYQLGLMGAEIVKVELPGKGDQCRALLDEDDFGKGMLAPMFIGINLNKRSIAMDLKHADAKATLEPLVKQADVVVENFRPGVIERLGFGYEAVRALKPSIVYCSISGYGQNGPRSTDAAYDGAVQAASGLMATNGHEETGPTRTISPVIDVTTGLMAALAISSALHRRSVSGEGQHIDVAMLDSAVTLLNPLYNIFLATGTEPELLGNQSIARLPTCNVFPTRDSYIQVTALTDEQTVRFCAAMGCSHLLEEERFKTRHARIANRDDMRAELLTVFIHETTQTWLARLNAAGVPVAPVSTLPEVMADPQLVHRGLTAELSPHSSLGVDKVASVTTGFVTNIDGPRADRTAPLLGEHTEEVLAEYGFDREAINRMRDSGLLPAG